MPVLFIFFRSNNQSITLRPDLILFLNLLLDIEEASNIFKNKRAKRRHARPLELHSDDESKTEPTTGNDEMSETSEAVVAANDLPQIVVRGFLHFVLQLCQHQENSPISLNII